MRHFDSAQCPHFGKIIKRRRAFWSVVFLGMAWLFGCTPSPPLRREIQKDWTLMVYMVADNNLDPFSVNDINEMEWGVDPNHSDVIVYLDRVVGATPDYPVVLTITNDETSDIVSPIVKSYGEQNSCDWQNLREFINFAKVEYPSRHYGLIVWSHGSGWVPATLTTKSIGLDVSQNRSEMEIADLATALEGQNLDFLAFDACLMGDVEVAYTLRKSVPLILFSQTEILSDGFPYDRILPLFQGNNTREILKKVAKNYFDFYQNQDLAFFRSASVSLVNHSRMKQLAVSLSNYLETVNDSCKTNMLDISDRLQRVTLLSTYSNVKFDLLDFVKEINDNEILKTNQRVQSAFSNVLDSWHTTVLYHTNTLWFENQLKLSLGGLNCFLPIATNDHLIQAYQKQAWYQDAGMFLLFR